LFGIWRFYRIKDNNKGYKTLTAPFEGMKRYLQFLLYIKINLGWKESESWLVTYEEAAKAPKSFEIGFLFKKNFCKNCMGLRPCKVSRTFSPELYAHARFVSLTGDKATGDSDFECSIPLSKIVGTYFKKKA
jgi:hypothetical protein